MNTQQKQRFFALYYGVACAIRANEVFTINHFVMYEFESYKLRLTHRSKITDAHALYIANDILKWQRNISDEAKIFQIKELLESRHQTNLNQFQWERIYSFMRGNSYAMPFDGMSIEQMVESGKAELK